VPIVNPHKLDLSTEQRRRVDELLEICRQSQGPYLEPHHGPWSWATTYGNEFIDAATELYGIYSAAKLVPPIPPGHGTRYALGVIFDLMAQAFSSANVRSCRGTFMDTDKVRYLYEAHIYKKLYPDAP
jgi:hypothetical protein